MQTELIRSSYSKKNERNEKEEMNTDSIPLTSTALATLDKQHQPEQVRIFLYRIYYSPTSDI
jgi:hypothetical protein